MDSIDLIKTKPFIQNIWRQIALVCFICFAVVHCQNYEDSFALNSNADYRKRGEDWTGTCQTGIRQSPTDILLNEVYSSQDVKVQFNCTDIVSGEIELNGSELISRFAGCKATYVTSNENSNWTSDQFHFHSPAEHLIDKESFDAEMHLVFTNDNDNRQIMVLGILFDFTDNASDIPLLKSLSFENILTDKKKAISDVPLKDFIGSTVNDNIYNYQGSLTTPTCDEVVEWMVYKNPVLINKKQLSQFEVLWSKNPQFAEGNGNNRIVKGINRRPVFYLGSDSKSKGNTTWFIIGFTAGGILLIASVGAGIFLCVRKKRKSLIVQKMSDYRAVNANDNL